MQREGPAGQAGFESMFIDWKPPPPIPDWLSDVVPPSIEKLYALGKGELLIEPQEGRQPDATVQVATNVSPCLGIVRVVSDAGVILLDPCVNVWDVPGILTQ